MKSFSKWTIAEVEKEFGLRRVLKSSLLDEWLTIQCQPTDFERQLLYALQAKLEKRVYAWNEDELKVNFIAPLLSLVDFESEKYHVFSERRLTAPYNDEELWGDVDFLISQGVYTPERPFFFIHEYKREDESSSSSPLGQLMVTMVAAQILNQDDLPLYGVYIRGRHWHFAILQGKEYVINSGFNALTDNIFNILAILKNTRMIIDKAVS